tara:strand:- start:503 stop:658 length:156 start_codon:yes stop_codon:yes gene_type:complete
MGQVRFKYQLLMLLTIGYALQALLQLTISLLLVEVVVVLIVEAVAVQEDFV